MKKRSETLPAAARRQLVPLVKNLPGLDDQLRRATVMAVKEHGPGPVVRWLIDRLIALLSRTGRADYQPILDSLTELGESAAPALRYALLTGRTPEFQLHVVEVLARIGQTLPPDGWRRIKLEFQIALSRSQDESVIMAILKAMDAVEPGAAAAEVAWRTRAAREVQEGRIGVEALCWIYPP
jgi:hypothetical protein